LWKAASSLAFVVHRLEQEIECGVRLAGFEQAPGCGDGRCCGHGTASTNAYAPAIACGQLSER
jgi:hypothetical protein